MSANVGASPTSSRGTKASTTRPAARNSPLKAARSELTRTRRSIHHVRLDGGEPRRSPKAIARSRCRSSQYAKISEELQPSGIRRQQRDSPEVSRPQSGHVAVPWSARPRPTRRYRRCAKKQATARPNSTSDAAARLAGLPLRLMKTSTAHAAVAKIKAAHPPTTHRKLSSLSSRRTRLMSTLTVTARWLLLELHAER